MTRSASQQPHSSTYRRAGSTALVVIALGLFAAASPAHADQRAEQRTATTQRYVWPVPDDDLVLPSRVSVAIDRTQNAVDRAAELLDDRRFKAAKRSLRATRENFVRAHRAGLAQMSAPVDEEAESTPGPDSVNAVLLLEQMSITKLAGLFDGVKGRPGVVSRIEDSLRTADRKRNRMLDAVIALDPEEAGADYADAMADSVAGYADEVANLEESLKWDRLSRGGRAAVERTLHRSRGTTAKVSAAFGGGE